MSCSPRSPLLSDDRDGIDAGSGLGEKAAALEAAAFSIETYEGTPTPSDKM
jgi:hypothetical protein